MCVCCLKPWDGGTVLRLQRRGSLGQFQDVTIRMQNIVHGRDSYDENFSTNIRGMPRNLYWCQSVGEIILVLMPFWDHVVRHILTIIREVDWPVPVETKFHPSTDRKMYEHYLPEGVLVTDENLPELLLRTRMIVGRDSGTQVEAAALGIPVIDIRVPDQFSHGCMPETGKGILWNEAVGAGEVARRVSQFQEILQSNPSLLKEEGARLRSTYFTEPTDELIGQAFGLD